MGRALVSGALATEGNLRPLAPEAGGPRFESVGPLAHASRLGQRNSTVSNEVAVTAGEMG